MYGTDLPPVGLGALFLPSPRYLETAMARVTVEDCIEKIPNRFDLVLTASQRARGIMKGDLPTLDRDNDKNPVIAVGNRRRDR